MQTYYSNGKLLLTGEYVVLDGAEALALPTQFGQTLSIQTIHDAKIIWKSVDEKNAVWFEDIFVLSNNEVRNFVQNNNPISTRLLQILNVAKTLNPQFLSGSNGFKITSTLDFPQNWGLGSSSTLLNNIAQWAKVDAFTLSNATFGGSGYDIACAQHDFAIMYQRNENSPKIKPITFKKAFENELFFIHLNQKKNSREAIRTYQEHKKNSTEVISRINTITHQILDCNTLELFETLIEEHETIIGTITNQTPVKQRLFNDYRHTIKSLGGWGGDFILATGPNNYVNNYFKSNGYNTVIPFNDMILK